MWESILAAGMQAAGSLAGGAMSSAGAASNNAANLAMAREQMQYSAAQAQRQMDFQERMSNTSYQRAMADMKTAGLNPILAYQQGGAGTPPGAAGQSAGANFENTMTGLGHGVSSASQAGKNLVDLENVRAQTANTVTQADLNKANTQLTGANTLKATQDTATSAAQMRKADADTALTVEQMENPKAYRALAGAQSHSAFQAGELSRVQREQLGEYGPHWTGQLIGSADRVWKRIVPVLQDFKSGHDAEWERGMKPLREGYQQGQDARKNFDARVKGWIERKAREWSK